MTISKGRIDRSAYLGWIIVYLFILIIADSNGTDGHFDFKNESEKTQETIWGLVKIIGFFFILNKGAKRCHDFNRSGWWQLIPFYFIYMIFRKGDLHENNYGPINNNSENV